jgi:AcrR family transcriptional regulator
MTTHDRKPALTPRAQVLLTASRLFYSHGIRAVGIDLIVEESGIAKTTLYRHFPSKDDLIEAFLKREDEEFWQQWDAIVHPHRADSRKSLLALCSWIGDRVSRDSYRGCPQINAASEFSSVTHPARKVARLHKEEMLRRLQQLCRESPTPSPDIAATQISLLFDGAFSSDGRLKGLDGPAVLRDGVLKLLKAK